LQEISRRDQFKKHLVIIGEKKAGGTLVQDMLKRLINEYCTVRAGCFSPGYPLTEQQSTGV